MTITVLAAIAANNVIGIDGSMAWYEPEELRLFKSLTTGDNKLLVVGSKTFFSMPESVWTTRKAVVISNRAETRERIEQMGLSSTVSVSSDLDAVLRDYRHTNDVIVIGGQSIYAQVLLQPRLIDKLIVSEMHHPYEGDAFFPLIFGSYQRSGVLYTGYNFTTYVWRKTDDNPDVLSPYKHQREVLLASQPEIAAFLRNYTYELKSDLDFFLAVAPYTIKSPLPVYKQDGVLTLIAGSEIVRHLPQLDGVAKACALLLGHKTAFRVSLNNFTTVLTGSAYQDSLRDYLEDKAETSRAYRSSADFRRNQAIRIAETREAQAKIDEVIKRLQESQTAPLKARIEDLSTFVSLADHLHIKYDKNLILGIINTSWFTEPVEEDDKTIDASDLTDCLAGIIQSLNKNCHPHPITASWLRELL